MLVEFSDLHIPPCAENFVQFMAFTLENALNLAIFTHAPVTCSKLQVQFFDNMFSHGQEQRVEKTMICFIKIKSDDMKVTWNFILFTFFMIYNFSKCDGLTVL